ncbi:hypothetical protein [Mesorhizobium sp. WSM2239]|uniref:Uncharacterized protein n=2 Tax=unclassified Mesorhizobium TaxID=325217 RepID=A0AAU8DB57_9HYPH
MTFKNIAVAALALLTLGSVAAADDLKPMHSRSIDLGTMTGIAYYTVEPDGYHVVATLAQNDAGEAVRFETVLVSGQTMTLSTPRGAGMPPVKVEISRTADQIRVLEAVATN